MVKKDFTKRFDEYDAVTALGALDNIIRRATKHHSLVSIAYRGGRYFGYITDENDDIEMADGATLRELIIRLYERTNNA